MLPTRSRLRRGHHGKRLWWPLQRLRHVTSDILVGVSRCITGPRARRAFSSWTVFGSHQWPGARGRDHETLESFPKGKPRLAGKVEAAGIEPAFAADPSS